jgi:hypothetical protein
MSDSETNHFKLEAPGVYEIVQRTGEAVEAVNPQKYSSLYGDIMNPVRYFKQRTEKGLISPDLAVFSFNEEGLQLRLYVDPKTETADDISGKMNFSAFVQEFGLQNGGADKKMFGRDQFIRAMKLQRPYFKDPNTAITIIQALTAFEAKVTAEVSKQDAGRGQMVSSLKRSSEIPGLPRFVTFLAPVFRGAKEQELECEILSDVSSDGAVALWLECPAVLDAIRAKVNEIKGELEELEIDGVLVLYE